MTDESRGPIAFAGLVAVLLALPYILRDFVFATTRAGEIRAASYLSLVSTAMIFAIAAVGLAVLVGYTGLLSLGHGNFLIIGGYTMAVVARRDGGSPWLTFVVVIVVSAAVGAALGLPACHLRGFYFTVMTLIFLPIGFVLSGIIVDRLGGIAGRGGRGRLVTDTSTAFGYRAGRLDPTGRMGNRAAFYLIVLVFLCANVLFVYGVVKSRYGRAFQAIRESETAARAAGIWTYMYKVLAVSISAAVVGIAGALYAQDPQFGNRGAVPSGLLDQSLSFLLVAMNVVGGLGTIAGPVIGASGLRLVPDLLFGTSSARDLQALIIGMSTLLAAIGAPLGLVGLLADTRRRRRERVARAGPLILDHVRARSPSAGELSRAEARYVLPRKSVPDMSDAWRVPVSFYTGGSGPLLELRGMGRRFGGLQALLDVDLSVEKGAVHALIGPNGSGKTTLINCVSGFYRPTSGRVILRGRDIGETPAHARARMGVARTFQNLQIWRRLSLLDNVRVGGHVHTRGDLFSAVVRAPWVRRPEKELLHRAWGMLAFMGLDFRGHELAGSLSFVDQRRLEIARALCAQPELLLLDEPAAGMSHAETLDLIEEIARIRSCGITVLLVEHHMDVVLRVADRVSVLDYGVLIAEGSPAEVASNHRVIEAYLGSRTD